MNLEMKCEKRESGKDMTKVLRRGHPFLLVERALLHDNFYMIFHLLAVTSNRIPSNHVKQIQNRYMYSN